MGKRGVSEIDWIISLSIFLLYVGWFFAFVLPSMNMKTSEDSTVSFLKEDFYDEFQWQLSKFPLMLFSNKTGEYIPIISDYESNRTDIKFMDGSPLVLWNGKLIFLANISQPVEAHWMVSDGGYDQEYENEGIDIGEDYASTSNMTVSFSSSLADVVSYKEKVPIQSMAYSINSIEFEPINSTYDNLGIMAAYTARSGNINFTTLIFDRNPDIYGYITLDDSGSYTVRIDLELDDFESYYSSNLYFGDFQYEGTIDNINFDADQITIYGENSLSMFFDTDVNFNFTSYNSTLRLNIEIPVSENYEYRMSFHEGDYRNATRFIYNVKFGAIETLVGLDFDHITTDYDSLKEEWGFEKNFAIFVYDNSSAFEYLYQPRYIIGSFDPKGKPVYSESVDMYALTADGLYSPVSVNYRIW